MIYLKTYVQTYILMGSVHYCNLVMDVFFFYMDDIGWDR